MDQATMLDQLGQTADEVAAFLKKQQIQGVRNTVRFLNPIVRYVQGQVSDARTIDVMTGETLRILFLDGRRQEVSLPKAVKEFLDAFNRGAFPDLELPPDTSAAPP
jgi:hypothetical protein